MQAELSALTATPRYGYFAVKVRARGEGSVSKTLREKGFEVLAPTCTLPRVPCKRRRRTDLALFPGYVFVRFDPRDLLSLVRTHGVSYIVRSGGTLAPLSSDEELTVQTLCEGLADFEPWNRFIVGQRVLIESGPLMGRKGTLVRVGQQDRLIISLTSIFSSVSVDLRDTIVTACE